MNELSWRAGGIIASISTRQTPPAFIIITKSQNMNHKFVLLCVLHCIGSIPGTIFHESGPAFGESESRFQSLMTKKCKIYSKKNFRFFWIKTFLLRPHKKPQLFKTSVADPRHFGVDPDPYLDPRIHASDQWTRIRILLFSSLTFPRCQQKTNIKKKFFADYFLKALVHHFQR